MVKIFFTDQSCLVKLAWHQTIDISICWLWNYNHSYAIFSELKEIILRNSLWGILTMGEWSLFLNTVLVKSLRVPCVCQIRDKKNWDWFPCPYNHSLLVRGPWAYKLSMWSLNLVSLYRSMKVQWDIYLSWHEFHVKKIYEFPWGIRH